jgi:hypothetical protein
MVLGPPAVAAAAKMQIEGSWGPVNWSRSDWPGLKLPSRPSVGPADPVAEPVTELPKDVPDQPGTDSDNDLGCTDMQTAPGGPTEAPEAEAEVPAQPTGVPEDGVGVADAQSGVVEIKEGMQE